MTELPESVHEEIKSLSSQGVLLADEQIFGEAVAKNREAWRLVYLPCSPVVSHEAANAQES